MKRTIFPKTEIDKINTKYLYFTIAFIVSLYINTDNINNYIINHYISFGGTISKVIENLPTVIITTLIMYILFGNRTEKLLKEAVFTPENIIPRLKVDEIPQYIKHYMVKTLKLGAENSDAYWEIFDRQLLNLKEYHKNMIVEIETVGLPDKNNYRKLRIKTKYKIYNPAIPKLIFSCRLSENHLETIHDYNYTLSWLFANKPGETKLPENAFNVVSLFVGGKKFETKRIREEEKSDIEKSYADIVIFEPIGNTGDLNGKKVEYTIEVLQYNAHGFVSSQLKYLTRNYTVSINCEDSPDISSIYSIEFLLSNSNPFGSDSKKYSFRILNGWIAPKSGISFSWINTPTDSINQASIERENT